MLKFSIVLIILSVSSVAFAASVPRKKAHPTTIKGNCEFLESAKNPFPGPCIRINLMIVTPDGKEYSRTRTSDAGDFEFSIGEGRYQIQTTSKAYEVVSPLVFFRGGEKVNLRIRQK